MYPFFVKSNRKQGEQGPCSKILHSRGKRQTREQTNQVLCQRVTCGRVRWTGWPRDRVGRALQAGEA